MSLSHLQRLEAESIHIIREVAAEAENPVMLYSIGKDSSVMLHLAMKAFYPGKPPFPLLHVDTTWKFREMYEFRDRMAAELGIELLVHINQEGLERGINPFDSGSQVHTDVMKTEGLKQALEQHGFDAAFGGARRDEEKSRAKERVFSFRSAQHRWDPKNQRPELWHLYNARKRRGESIRVFPLSNWTELDVWEYVELEEIPVVPLYFAKERPIVRRNGTLLMVDDDRMPLEDGETPEQLQGALPHARLLPADRRGGERRRDARGHRRRDARLADLRARGPRDRPRRRRLDGEEEAGGVLLSAVREQSLLRFITCGSVDDGKSTLIGRLLFESGLILEDQMAALEADSRRSGTTGDALDFALLLDGLSAEREQGITIDVSHRYFSTARRHFIVADTPGHEQYTRNMVTGASTADCAVILLDARKGVLSQTRRHSWLVALLGIRHVVLAVNKMDLVEFSEARFGEIEAEYAARREADRAARRPMHPGVGAGGRQRRRGRASNTPWYDGPTLLEYLETVEVDLERLEAAPFRMPVQLVSPPELRLPRLRRHDRRRLGAAGRRDPRAPARHAQRPSSASSPTTATSTRRSPARRSRSRSPTRSTPAAAT